MRKLDLFQPSAPSTLGAILTLLVPVLAAIYLALLFVLTEVDSASSTLKPMSLGIPFELSCLCLAPTGCLGVGSCTSDNEVVSLVKNGGTLPFICTGKKLKYHI